MKGDSNIELTLLPKLKQSWFIHQHQLQKKKQGNRGGYYEKKNCVKKDTLHELNEKMIKSYELRNESSILIKGMEWKV